jgi:small subunit ribosomal protein S6
VREYETVFIIDPSCDESQVEQEVNAVKEIIVAGDGKVVEAESWGRRRLAYDIKKKKEGTYAFVRFSGEPSVLQELNRRLKLNELILRHLIVVSQQAEGGELDSGLAALDESDSYESEDSLDY